MLLANSQLFYEKIVDLSFYGLPGVITHLGCLEKTRNLWHVEKLETNFNGM